MGVVVVVAVWKLPRGFRRRFLGGELARRFWRTGLTLPTIILLVWRTRQRGRPFCQEVGMEQPSMKAMNAYHQLSRLQGQHGGCWVGFLVLGSTLAHMQEAVRYLCLTAVDG